MNPGELANLGELTQQLSELLPLDIWSSTEFERTAAIATGLLLPHDAACWTVGEADAAPLAYLVLLPGSDTDERRARAAAAADPSDPKVAEAVARAREAIITVLKEK